MTVEFRHPKKCETCGHCVTGKGATPIVDVDGEHVTDATVTEHVCLAYGGCPLRVRPDCYCVMWEPMEEHYGPLP